MIRYIDEHKDRFGVEGICRVLGAQLACGFLTASGYWPAKRREPAARTLSATASCCRFWSACMLRTTASTACGRCGGCSTGRVTRLAATRSLG